MNYLIRFRYEYWCQGYEWTTETILVNNVPSFETACKCITMTFKNAKDFVNLTYEMPLADATNVSKLVKQS